MRLVVLCEGVFVCVYMLTNNSNDVIVPTAQATTPAVTFPSLREAALPSPSPFLVVMFKSLHLAEICTLTSGF